MDMGSPCKHAVSVVVVFAVALSGVVLSGDYRSCLDVSHLSPAQHSQVLIDPQDTFYNFIFFLNIE